MKHRNPTIRAASAVLLFLGATESFHHWDKAMNCGEVTFPKSGPQLLTLQCDDGNNLAYFEFTPVVKK